MENKIHKGLILAGGKGTRFLPWTAGASKTMLPLVDRPTLAYIVDEFILSGITDILIVVGYQKDGIIDYFNKMLPKINEEYSHYCYNHKLKFKQIFINFAVQHKQLGTANAILQAQKFVGNDDFVVACGDELFLAKTPVLCQLLKAYEKFGTAIVASKLLPKSEATRFGVLKTERIDKKQGKLIDIIEKPAITDIALPLVNLGRYVLPNSIFDYICKVAPNKSGEYALTDALILMTKSLPVICYNFDGVHYDIGDKVGYSKAFVDFALKNEITGTQLNKYLIRKIKNNIV